MTVLFAEILSEYERAREQAEAAQTARKSQAYALHGGFALIDEKRNAATRQIASAIKRGVSAVEAAEQARAALRALAEEEERLLLSVGLPRDFLALKPRCSLCGDTGYVGEPRKTACVCLTRRLMEEQRASSSLDSRETFEAFDESIFPSETQRKQMQKARAIAEQFADALPDTSKHNLVLLGTAGLGKTYLLNCIGARALARGMQLKKVTAYTLQDELLAGIRKYTDSAATFLQVPLLLIDDLGTEPMLNNITREYIFSILNERRNGKRHTVVASNLTSQQLQERYGERVFSRLVSTDDSAVMQLSGQNLRLVGRRDVEGP